MSSNNNGITPEEGHKRLRHWIRNYMSAKKERIPFYPEDLQEMIANAGVDAIVDEILDDPQLSDKLVPDWANREMITAAVESLLWDPVLTSE